MTRLLVYACVPEYLGQREQRSDVLRLVAMRSSASCLITDPPQASFS